MNRLLLRPFSKNARLLALSDVQLTLFSKPNCGLCEEAKENLQELLDDEKLKSAHIKLKEVNINELQNQKWWKAYCFDIPVLHIENTANKDLIEKVFHRMDEEEILGKINKVK